MQNAQQTPHQTSQFSGMLSSAELAASIKRLRAAFFMTQEELAYKAGLNVRTIQRIERGEPSDLKTRRELARAFDFEDIDFYNKPFTPTEEEELIAERVSFELSHVTLAVSSLDSGKLLAQLVESTTCDMSVPTYEMTREADEIFAALIDNFRNYRDVAEKYSELKKFEVYDLLQCHIDELKAMDVLLCYANYNTKIKIGDSNDSWSTKALVLASYPVGGEQKVIKIPRDVEIDSYACTHRPEWEND